MRVEDKELEGPELLHQESLEVLEERDEDAELPVLASEEVVDIELAHRGRVFDALALILERQQLTVSLLGLPKREADALEFLQTAVNGRDVHMGEFVYAEDRMAMLEQALAVLQQNITYGDAGALATLHAKFASLTDRLAEIREQLSSLEESEDDHDYVHERVVGVATPAATDKPDESLSGFLASALSALAEVAGTTVKPTTLTGDELPEPPKPATTLVGDEVREQPRASTLSAGEPAPEKPAQPSTLTGPELPAAPPSRSTLSEDKK